MQPSKLLTEHISISSVQIKKKSQASELQTTNNLTLINKRTRDEIDLGEKELYLPMAEPCR
jgi:hypothetical protein